MSDELREKYEHHISYSQLRTFQKCPRQWQRDKVFGEGPPGDTVHTIGGTAFHETVQAWLRLFYDDGAETPGAEAMKSGFKERLKKEYDAVRESEDWQELDAEPTDAEELAEYCRGTWPIFDELVERADFLFEPSDMELVGIEEEVDTELKDGVGFIGYLDVVLKAKNQDQYAVIDLKTSTKGWDKWKKQDELKTNQLAAYKQYWAQRLDVPVGDVNPRFIICQRELGEWDNRHVESFIPPSGSDKREEIQGWIEEMLEKGFENGKPVEDREMEKRPGKFDCVFCPFSEQFGEVGGCDQNGQVFDGYPEGMRPYIDDKWIS